jgi:threonine aldolase
MTPEGNQQFASDNYAGICPEAMRSLEAANQGSTPAYGDDPWSLRLSNLFDDLFGVKCESFLALNGTAANAMALAALCRPYDAVICSSQAHVLTHECGAPEFFSGGARLISAPGSTGKLTPDLVDALCRGDKSIESPRPRVLTITQATETGEVYRPHEIQALAAVCKERDLYLHMDGARISNACAFLECDLQQITWQAGVDVLSFGGTKNGIAMGEAVIFFDNTLARDFAYRRKQAGQLASKMRFVAAQWIGLLDEGVWLSNARHANRCAQQFAKTLEDVRGVTPIYPIEANAVFLTASPAVFETLLSKGWQFYRSGDAARFMFAWDSNPTRIEALADDIRLAALSNPA